MTTTGGNQGVNLPLPRPYYRWQQIEDSKCALQAAYHAVIDQLEGDVELQELGDLRDQVDREPLEAIVALQFFCLDYIKWIE